MRDRWSGIVATSKKSTGGWRRFASRLTGAQRREFDGLSALVRRYVALREDSKDFLMLGYDLLRDLAREAGRRLDIGDDVFYLTRDEVFDSLRVGFAPYHLIEQRKIAYRAESRLTLPRVIDAQAIDTLGETPAVKPNADGHKALAVSTGEATGPARIVRSPAEAGDLGRGYILVCPSTDPSWTPLFVNAAGLVLECGGTLSHGAVVAREMGLPAVVLPEATSLFHEGEELHVDGSRGWVCPAGAPVASPGEWIGPRRRVQHVSGVLFQSRPHQRQGRRPWRRRPPERRTIRSSREI